MLRRVLVLSVLVGLVMSVQAVVRGERGRFTRFVATSLPQRAIGDFDGDGLLDVANIDARGVDRDHISVTLSGSPDAILLDASVASLIEDDVDHDGDLDLLATTGSGDVLIWVNDGHGQFTRRPQSSTRTLSGLPTLQSRETGLMVGTTTQAPVLAARLHSWRARGPGAIRPPTDDRVFIRIADLLPPLRAPPLVRL